MLTTPLAEPLGSAVVVARGEGGYWLVTSRHVVESELRVCVVSEDGSTAAAQVLAPLEKASRLAIDAALLWQPEVKGRFRAKSDREIAVFANPMPLATEFPVVIATGFPATTEDLDSRLRYIESSGLLLPLLKEPIEGGFDLTSTVSVRKGMSGGGLFWGKNFIGIRGTHAHPLWSGVLFDRIGQPLSYTVNQQLEQVSLSVSAPTIQRMLTDTKKPSAQQLRGIETIACEGLPFPPSQNKIR